MENICITHFKVKWKKLNKSLTYHNCFNNYTIEVGDTQSGRQRNKTRYMNYF